MVERKELVKSDVKHKEASHFYHLKTTHAPRLQNWKHEFDCANIYIALQTLDLIHTWQYEASQEFLDLGLMPDRTSILLIDGKPLIVFWEMDEGTMKHSRVSEKIPKYKTLFQRHPDAPSICVICAPTITRTKNILHKDVLPQGYVKQFLGCEYSRLLNDPLSECLYQPIELEKPISFRDLV
jgi:hypothetical protein